MQPYQAGFPDATVREGHSMRSVDATDRVEGPFSDDAPSEMPARIARYVIQREIGQGGFGVVFLAFDPLLNRATAIKVPRQTTAWSLAQTQAFLEEARLIANLKHSHIVTVYDAGSCPEFGVFLAMEYVEGETLSRRLRSGKLSSAEAIRICDQIADAIHQGHKSGLVHRDLKPANILLDQANNAKVCDFGLALHEDTQREHQREFSGTLPYMSPEQARGESHLLDGRSDLWSLGVILYECLAGRRPFRGESREEITAEILTRDPKPLRQLDDTIPEALDLLCRRCLERDLSRRLRSAADFRDALAAVERETRQSPVVPARMRSMRLGAGVAVLGLGLGMLAWNNLPDGERSPPREPSPPVAAPEATSDAVVHRMLSQAIADAGTDWHPLRGGEEFFAQAISAELFQLGSVTEVEEIELDLKQGRWTGGIGLFLGHQPSTRYPKSFTFQALVVEPQEDQWRVHRIRYDYPVSNPTFWRAHFVASAPIETARNNPLRMKIKVSKGQLQEVAVDGRALPELTDAEVPAFETISSNGPFGVVLNQSAGTVSRFIWNGKPRSFRLDAALPEGVEDAVGD